MIIDVAFLVANGVKFLDGAWFPVVLGDRACSPCCAPGAAAAQLLHAEIRKDGIQLDTFLPGLMLAPPTRVPGTAVFLTAQTGIVPHALLHNLKHNKVLHERNVLLTVETLNVPHAPKRRAPEDRTDRRRLLPRRRCASASWKRRTCRWR